MRDSVFFTAAVATPAAATPAAAADSVGGEERMLEGLFKAETLGWVVLQHLLQEVKKLLVVLTFRYHVILVRREERLLMEFS